MTRLILLLLTLAACESTEVTTFHESSPAGPAGAGGAGAGGAGSGGAGSGGAGQAGAGAGGKAGAGQAGSTQAGAAGSAGAGAGGGGSGGAGSAGAGGQVALSGKSLEELCLARAQATMSKRAACQGQLPAEDQASLQQLLQDICVATGKAPGASPQPLSIEECPAQIAAASCAEMLAFQQGFPTKLDAACGTLAGTLPEGAPCASGAQCATGRCGGNYWCDGVICGASGRCGACAPLAQAGQPCSSLQDCQPGLLCLPTGHCGQPASQGAPCSALSPCPPGLYCDGTCKPVSSLGEPCNSKTINSIFDSCGTALLYCSPDEKKCVPAEISGNEGDECGLLLGAGRKRCRLGLSCKLDQGAYTGTCHKAPAEGEPCKLISAVGAFPCAALDLECVKDVCVRVATLDPASCQ